MKPRTIAPYARHTVAFVVLAAGVLAGAGFDAVASGIIAVTLLLLVEKRQLHGLVARIDRAEMRAGG